MRLSEPCKAWCTGLLLHMAQQSKATTAVKATWYSLFKKEYARRAKIAKRGSTIEPPTSLPDPMALQASHSDLYAEVFPAEPPIAPLIDVTKIDLPQVDCRQRKGSLLALEEPRRTTDEGGRVLEQLVSLQSEHLKLLHSTLGGQQPQAPTSRSLRALAAGPMQAMRPLTLPSSSSAGLHALLCDEGVAEDGEAAG